MSGAELSKTVAEHSPFGYNMDIPSDGKGTETEDTKAVGKKLSFAKILHASPRPPDIHKEKLSEREQVELHRNRLKSMKESLQHSENELKEREAKARAFKSTGSHLDPGKNEDLRHSSRSHPKNDFPCPEKKNAKNGYNWDTHCQNTPPLHKYSLMGDILKTGNGFSVRTSDPPSRTPSVYSTTSLSLPPRVDKPVPPLPEGETLMDFVNPSAVSNIPPNILHKFGSREVDNLLQDKSKVMEILQQQKETKNLRRVPIYQKLDLPGLPKSASTSYDSLSSIGRSNLFPGCSINQNHSTLKSVHNDDVYLHRVPAIEKYKYKRDELSAWAEQDVIRARLKKAWNEIYLGRNEGPHSPFK